ncbi:hypothetical protein [Caulobacter sp. S45]|jgi:hypothetical protein|uniref:hypothetical protein n=1 Tax=Caulobacter sp. S45 TaxID=1641861 RepID=UPI0015764544|nr:hypothetical protein [Caulobacter sp. S45]
MLRNIALSAALLLAALQASNAQAQSQPNPAAAEPAAAKAENPLAREPLYADIVRRASALRSQVAAYRAAPDAALPKLDQFKTDLATLSELDMKGHVDLAKRGTDGDLKCILKGISEDLPKKLAEVEQASAPGARAAALEDMFYLLRDNIEVITVPPTVHS